MKFQTITAAALAAASLASTALAQHADTSFYSIGTRLATRGWDDANEVPLDYQRVFEGELSILGPAVYGEEPGYNVPDGTFSGSGTATVSIRKALLKWTGSSFTSTTDRINFQLYGGAQSVYTPVSDPANPDTDPLGHFGWAIDSAGGFHDHPDYYLVDAATTGNGSVGIYLAEFHADVDVDGLTRSYPFWKVFNYGESEEDHEAAIDYTLENIVPAPATAALFGAFGAMIACRRRP